MSQLLTLRHHLSHEALRNRTKPRQIAQIRQDPARPEQGPHM